MSTNTSALRNENFTQKDYSNDIVVSHDVSSYLLHWRICILQFQVQHVNAQLLEYLQCACQAAHLIVQRENDGRFIAGCDGFSWLSLVGGLQEMSCANLYTRMRRLSICSFHTTNSLRLCSGLPSLSAHSCSPLRYSHKPRSPLPEPLIVTALIFLSFCYLM